MGSKNPAWGVGKFSILIRMGNAQFNGVFADQGVKAEYKEAPAHQDRGFRFGHFL